MGDHNVTTVRMTTYQGETYVRCADIAAWLHNRHDAVASRDLTPSDRELLLIEYHDMQVSFGTAWLRRDIDRLGNQGGGG